MLAGLFQPWHEEPFDDAFSCADDHFHRLATAFTLKIAERRKALAGDDVQARTGLRECDTAAFAADEFCAEKLFEFLDLAAKQALPGRVTFGRPRDAASLGHKAETLQAVQRQPALTQQMRKHDSKVMTTRKFVLEEKAENGDIRAVNQTMKENDQPEQGGEHKPDETPTLHFFRATPPDMMLHPPLASSLQTLETSFLLIAFGRYPSALVACASAWESVIKAKLGIPQEDKIKTHQLLELIRRRSAGLRNWNRASLDRFCTKRNRIAHYGFSPKDDSECARLLLETGLPFLSRCYLELFGFRLEAAGLLPELAAHLRVAFRVYSGVRKLAAGPRGMESSGPNEFGGPLGYSCCFLSLARLIRYCFRDIAIQPPESEYLQTMVEVCGSDWEREWEFERQQVARLERALKNSTWIFNCPVCGGPARLVAELDDRGLEERRVTVKFCACAKCNLVVPREAPLLAEVLLAPQLEKEADKILKEYGIK